MDYPEFIELFNMGENPVNLEGFAFTKGIDYKFLQGSTILPGEGLVLTNDTALFKNRYGFKAFSQFNKRLDNKGEILILENRFNQVVDSVFYSDTIPWPVAADGEGFSVEVINPNDDNSPFINWKISESKYGSPFESQIMQEIDASLYPNPFHDMIYINLKNQDLEHETFIVEFFNLFGNRVKSIETINENHHNSNFDA